MGRFARCQSTIFNVSLPGSNSVQTEKSSQLGSSPSAKVTLASARTRTGEIVRGGPTRRSFFSHDEGAECAALKMSGISADAISSATYFKISFLERKKYKEKKGEG